MYDGVQVPFNRVRSRAKAVNAKRRVAKTAPVVVIVEFVLIIPIQGYR